MSALRDQTNLRCWECGTDLSNLDPIPPPSRHFVKCENDCEMGGIPINDHGDYDQCPICEGWGELVLCLPCYHKYLYSD